ncbi:MAG TPA: (2Fe-2S)-binding protein [Nitrososphaerales archaeon]|nr:(2Fe-2S)-binding protein [Nitrososphaerales archaeon]
MTRQITLHVNGRKHKVSIEDNWTLMRVLREEIGLKGTKEVCGIGECGACTIIKNGKPVSSCCELAVRADGSSIETIEGLANGPKLHPLQSAFIENSAFQCGYCTAGMIMMAKTLLDAKPTKVELSEKKIRNYMSGNLCRCTGYQQIIDAIKQASGMIAGTPKLEEKQIVVTK